MVLGNVREQRQSLKGSCERREHERESEQREQGAVGAGARSGEHEERNARTIGACTMLVAVIAER